MSTQTAGLQQVLAAEHAASWGYGVVGGHLRPAEQTAARSADQAHRSRRDTLTSLLVDRGAPPVAAAASYALPFPVNDAAAARRLAVHLEQGTAASWHATLGGSADPAIRRLSLAALTDAATRGLQWRLTVPGEPSTIAFPGT